MHEFLIFICQKSRNILLKNKDYFLFIPEERINLLQPGETQFHSQERLSAGGRYTAQ